MNASHNLEYDSLFQASLPFTFWVEALHTAVYLLNILPTASNHHKTPFELLFGRCPTYDHLRVFSCSCYPNPRDYCANKLSPRSIQWVFLGYPSNYKGFRCFDPLSNKVCISRHVRFDENSFPYPRPLHPNPQTISSNIFAHNPLQHPRTTAIPCDNSSGLYPPTSKLHLMVTRKQTGSLKPRILPSLISHISLLPLEPNSFTEANKSPHWKRAMDEECNALISNHIWDLVPPLSNANVIGYRWVYRVKQKSDGSLERYKA